MTDRAYRLGPGLVLELKLSLVCVTVEEALQFLAAGCDGVLRGNCLRLKHSNGEEECGVCKLLASSQKFHVVNMVGL